MHPRTGARMNDSAPGAIAARTARVLAWLSLPLVALVVLRTFDPLQLGTDGAALPAWLAPAAGALVALAGAAAALVAVVAALRDSGSLSRALDAAAAAALGAAGAVIALQGPAASGSLPSAGFALGLLAAALPLLGAELAGAAPVADRRARVAVAAGIFAWVELAPFIGILLGSELRPAIPATAAVAAVVMLVAATASIAAGRGDRAGWTAGIAAGAGILAVARPGTADVLPGLVAIGAALVGMALWESTALQAATGPAAPAPADHGDLLPGPPLRDRELADEGDRLARELRATIAELLAAHETIVLQRAELEQLAEVDSATRVATRHAILTRLSAELAEARRYAHPIAIVLIDLDGLTGLNGRYGLPIGDAVLAELALRLRMRIREADGIGRLSGDTFIAILPHTDERGATVFADAVRTRLTARPVQTNAGPVHMTVSIGITVVRDGVSDGDDHELLARAEEALNSARAAGGNRIAFDRTHGLARLEERAHADTDDPGPDGSVESDAGSSSA